MQDKQATDYINKFCGYTYVADTVLKCKKDFEYKIPKEFVKFHTLYVVRHKKYRIVGFKNGEATLIGSANITFCVTINKIKEFFDVSHCFNYFNGATNEEEAEFASFIEDLDNE